MALFSHPDIKDSFVPVTWGRRHESEGLAARSERCKTFSANPSNHGRPALGRCEGLTRHQPGGCQSSATSPGGSVAIKREASDELSRASDVANSAKLRKGVQPSVTWRITWPGTSVFLPLVSPSLLSIFWSRMHADHGSKSTNFYRSCLWFFHCMRERQNKNGGHSVFVLSFSHTVVQSSYLFCSLLNLLPLNHQSSEQHRGDNNDNTYNQTRSQTTWRWSWLLVSSKRICQVQ